MTEYYYPHLGGIETVIKEIAERLVKTGHNVHIITCKLKNTQIQEDLNGVIVHRVAVPEKGDRYWFNSFWAIPTIIKLNNNCDIFHAGCHNSAFPTWFVATMFRKKKIVTIHEPLGKEWNRLSGMHFFKAKFHEMAEKILLSLSFDKYICVSKSSLSRLKTINPRINVSKQIVIYNGIDNVLFNVTKANGTKVRENLGLNGYFVYMSFGRPGISKGIEYLVKAVPLIDKKIPNAKLLLILDTYPNNRYKHIVKMIRELNLEDKLILLKPVQRNELPNYIAAADMVVVPSLSEGFGLSAAEACAIGKPVVASNVASLPEIISGKHVLVEPANPQAIADGIAEIFCGKAHEIPPKYFNWDVCCQQYLSIYDSMIGT